MQFYFVEKYNFSGEPNCKIRLKRLCVYIIFTEEIISVISKRYFISFMRNVTHIIFLNYAMTLEKM